MTKARSGHSIPNDISPRALNAYLLGHGLKITDVQIYLDMSILFFSPKRTQSIVSPPSSQSLQHPCETSWRRLTGPRLPFFLLPSHMFWHTETKDQQMLQNIYVKQSGKHFISHLVQPFAQSRKYRAEAVLKGDYSAFSLRPPKLRAESNSIPIPVTSSIIELIHHKHLRLQSYMQLFEIEFSGLTSG